MTTTNKKKGFKKFVLRSLLALLPVALYVALYVALDPYRVLRPYDGVANVPGDTIDRIPNKRFVALEGFKHYDPQQHYDSFIFGSSRVGALHGENIKGYRAYNMTYSFGIPQEHLENLRTFLKAGIKIRMVLINVDEVCCAIDGKEHVSDPMHRPYPVDGDFLSFYAMYMKPEIVLQSLPIILKSKYDNEADWRKNFYENGWWIGYDMDTGFKFIEADPAPDGLQYQVPDLGLVVAGIKVVRVIRCYRIDAGKIVVGTYFGKLLKEGQVASLGGKAELVGEHGT